MGLSVKELNLEKHEHVENGNITYNSKLSRKIQWLITIIHVCDNIVYDGALSV